MEELFSDEPEVIVFSNRILYTPSSFARSSLTHLQEIGELQAKQPHVSRRENLNSYLFFIVTAGSGKLDYNAKTYRLSQGDCVFIDCRKLYAHKTGDDLWTLKWIHFYGFNLSAIYDKYVERGGLPVFHPKDVSKFLAGWSNLFSLASSSDYIRDMKINNELNNLLTLLMGESWHPEIELASLKRQNLLPIKKYLDENYETKITLDDLAKQFFISKYYLTRVFKEQFGMSINQYLLSVRITKAKQMLRFTDEKVETIGHVCGLGAANYFSRIFRNVEGISPTEYREKWQSKNGVE